jgi:hypothetical protein
MKKANIIFLTLTLIGVILSACDQQGQEQEEEQVNRFICGESEDFSGNEYPVDITFDIYPDGSPVVADTAHPPSYPDGPYVSLTGTEYEDCGINIGTSWINLPYPHWDLSGTCVVAYTDFYETGSFLARENDSACSGRVLHITFSNPVSGVGIQFIGASTDYYLEAYDKNGNEIGMSAHTSVFDKNSFPRQYITFNSDQKNIDSIRFYGTGTVIEDIERLSFNY